MKSLLKGQKVSPAVVKQLKFSSVLSKQITSNFNEVNSTKKKRILANMISGKIVKKYKCLQKIMCLTSRRTLINAKAEHIKQKNMLQEKNDVINFLEKDINSRICAGKKESITRKKVKKQKRFLCDTMLMYDLS